MGRLKMAKLKDLLSEVFEDSPKVDKFKDKLSRMGDQKFRQWWIDNKLT